jgi:hypothetical protein
MFANKSSDRLCQALATVEIFALECQLRPVRGP